MADGVIERRAEASARKKGLTGAREKAYVGGALARVSEAHARATVPGKGARLSSRAARVEARNDKPQRAARTVGQVESIPMDRIHVGLNPREYFDPEALQKLAASIKENGLLQPISVRPHEGGYQVIAGERRLRALQALGRKEAPVIVKDVSDAEADNLAIIENISRADMRPTETGRAYQRLLARGMSKEDIAKQTGESLNHVNDHLALVDTMEPHLQGLVDNGRLPMSLTRDLARLSPSGREEAAERILSRDLGTKSAKALIRTIHAREHQMTLFGSPQMEHQTKDAHAKYREAVDKLTSILGGLDDETIQRMTPALDSPHREKERIDLMIKQLQRWRRTLELAGHARETGGGV